MFNKLDPKGGLEGGLVLSREISNEINASRHLYILVHGFGGSKFDLHLIQKVIAYQNPRAMFMHSGSNEGKTDGDIGKMGVNLSQEVLTFI